MSQDSLFFKKLKKSQSDLLELIQRRQYIILEPKKQLKEVMLTKNFFNNHICYKSPFNESLFINLNGKVLKYEHPRLKTFLGWTKEMIFNIKESTKMFDDNILCLQIDDYCDELSYDEKKTKISKGKLQKKNNMSEYLEYNKTLLNTDTNYVSIHEKFKKFTKEMKNNYMFLKGYEDDYAEIFNKRKNKLVNHFREVLIKRKDEDFNTSYTIAKELVDSLIFNEIYKFIFQDNLVNFYSDEEKKVKKFLVDNPSNYDLDDLKIDEVYHKCKFESAIKYLKNISSKKTIFEKFAVLNEVNNLITSEAKEIYESQNKKNFILNAKDLILFWTYVIAHCDTENILAEAKFIVLFGVTGYSATDYLGTNFFEAAKRIKNDILKDDNILSRYIEPNIIDLDGR